MAKGNNKAVMFLNLALILALLVFISTAEGALFDFGFAKKSTLTCSQVYGVLAGDTCFAVSQQFNLTAVDFSAINPNLDCTKIFVGQWLCVLGIA